MPLFGRRSQPRAAPPPTPPPPPAVQIGTLACSEPGCSRHDGVACAYLDNRNRSCPTAWCPDHQTAVHGLVLCRRHANTMAALGDIDPGAVSMPGNDNRIPSLINWVGDRIEQQVADLLAAQLQPGRQLARTAVHMKRDVQGRRLWMRSWRLGDHTGSLIEVFLDIDEAEPTTLRVRVGLRQLASAVPPWVAHHEAGEQVSPEQDAQERSAYLQDLVRIITTAVQHEVHA